MTDDQPRASCHCGAVTIALAAYSAEVTDCNCSLCRSYGVLWAYYSASDVSVKPDARTDTYACNDRHVDLTAARRAAASRTGSRAMPRATSGVSLLA